MTDPYTDELFHVDGAERLVFPVSPLVNDPERFRDDEDESMAAEGMGTAYTRTHGGRPLKTVADQEALMRRYYDPHRAQVDPGPNDLSLSMAPRSSLTFIRILRARETKCSTDQICSGPQCGAT